MISVLQLVQRGHGGTYAGMSLFGQVTQEINLAVTELHHLHGFAQGDQAEDFLAHGQIRANHQVYPQSFFNC